MRRVRIRALALLFLLAGAASCAGAQAALLLEEPYGLFGAVNPTGHTAIYLARVCAETPLKLRRCQPGELGVVLSRYQGISGYDWIAMPLVPYLYATERVEDAPAHADRETVHRLRSRYHEAHLLALGEDLSEGNFLHGGWAQLIGASYERRIYAYRFNTTPAQDDALMARLNADPNASHFNLFFNNCADFARGVLNDYFPRHFRRAILPDAGLTTPKMTTERLMRYSRKHPELGLTVYELPQISGYRRNSIANKNVAEALTTKSIYVVPLAVVNPYLTSALIVDYFARGRFRIVPRSPVALIPTTLAALAEDPRETDRSMPALANLGAPPLDELPGTAHPLRPGIVTFE